MIRALTMSVCAIALSLSATTQASDAQSPTARVAAANRAALREPSTGGYLHAVQVYPYSEGALYRLYAAPERVTDIALQPGEAVTSVAVSSSRLQSIAST